MKILVTGACGFIGSHFVEKLASNGHHVTALSFYNARNSNGWLDHINPDLKSKIKIISGDIRDYVFLLNASKNIYILFHLAALISIPYSYISPLSYINTNITGTYNILEATKKNKIKKTFLISTSEVYGSAETVPIKENHRLNAQSPYAASKIGADQMGLSYQKCFDLPITILRPFNTFGPRQSARAIIPTIVSQLLNGNKYIKLGNIHPKRDLTFIEDTTSAFLSAINCKQNISGEVINIGSGYELSIKDILNILKKDFGFNFEIIRDEERVRPKKSEVTRLLSCNKKAKKLLKWEPKFRKLNGFKKSLSLTIKWFQTNDNLNFYNHKKYSI